MTFVYVTWMRQCKLRFSLLYIERKPTIRNHADRYIKGHSLIFTFFYPLVLAEANLKMQIS